MAAFVYILCTLTSACCAALLLRGSRKPRAGLLFWSGAAFAVLAIGNALLFIDLIMLPETDLLIVRNLVTFIAIALLLYGLIWETE